MFNDENSENDYKNKFILCEYNSGSKKAFGLVDGKISCINLSDLNWHDFYESHKGEDDFIGWNNYLCQTAFEKNYCNDTLAFPDMESIRSLFSKEHKNIQQINFDNQKYKWKISQTTNKLLVYMDEKELCSINIFKKQNSSKFQELKWKILNNNALALLDNKTIKIFEYNNNKESIKIQYKFRRNSGLKVKEFSGPILPIMSDVKKDFLIEIISSIIEDERCLAKYGPTLLPNLIKSSDPELTRYIKDIYNKCMKLVKEDPKRNLKFLNIITSSMNDLHKKYPDHITKFNSEMFMLLDPFNEKIDDNDYSHFYPFCQEIKIEPYIGCCVGKGC
ncbi:4232_t:CDS:2 [Rhizophagus irregularis]|nr:4232_t:CDS:2 [Rhizophagus irregularis]